MIKANRRIILSFLSIVINMIRITIRLLIHTHYREFLGLRTSSSATIQTIKNPIAPCVESPVARSGSLCYYDVNPAVCESVSSVEPL